MSRKILLNSKYGGFGISELGITELKKLGYSDADIHMFIWGHKSRTNPDLIETFEKLGEAMNSGYCSMYIATIPEGYTDDCWEVREYDGVENLELIESMYKLINLEKELLEIKKENDELKLENKKLKSDIQTFGKESLATLNLLKIENEEIKNELQKFNKETSTILNLLSK